MKYKIYIVLIFCAFLCACNSNNNCNIAEEAEVKFKPLSETIMVEDIKEYVEDIVFVPIANETNALISDIAKVLVDTNNDIYILDTRSTITVYDKTGKFKMKISNKGRATNEYLGISDFALNSDEVVILDGLKIKCYNKNTGDYTRTIDIPFKTPCDAIAPDANGGMYLYAAYPADPNLIDKTKDFLLYRIDKDGKIVEQLVPRLDNTISLYNISQSQPNKYYLRPQNNSHIFYELAHGYILAKYQFDFEEQNIPHRYFFNNAQEDLGNYITSDYYKLPMSFYETQKSIFLKVCGPQAKEINIVYNKDSSNGIRWNNLLDDLSMQISASDSEYFYAILPELQMEDIKLHGPFYKFVIERLRKQDQKWFQKTYLVKVKFKACA